MTKDDIIRMAREAGFNWPEIHTTTVEERLERFAALAIAAERDKWEAKFKQLEALMQVREQQPNKPCCLAEREACAKVCEYYFSHGARDITAAIRARGET